MNKKAILILKMVAMLVVAAILAWQFYKAWHALAAMPKLVIDWRWGGIAILGFSASMLTSAIVWRLLAWNMGNRSPTLPLLAAYTFSQMGKYIPGKVGLLLMRIERAGRFGMSAQTCTLSTLLENALYMISGALVGLLAIVRIVAILDPGKPARLDRHGRGHPLSGRRLPAAGVLWPGQSPAQKNEKARCSAQRMAPCARPPPGRRRLHPVLAFRRRGAVGFNVCGASD